MAFTTENDVQVNNVYVQGQHASGRAVLPGIEVLVQNFGSLPKTGLPAGNVVPASNPILPLSVLLAAVPALRPRKRSPALRAR